MTEFKIKKEITEFKIKKEIFEGANVEATFTIPFDSGLDEMFYVFKLMAILFGFDDNGIEQYMSNYDSINDGYSLPDSS